MNRGFIGTGAIIKSCVLVLLVIVIALGVKSVTANDRGEIEGEETTGYREIEVVHLPKAVETPYPDFDLYNLSIIGKENESDDRIREDCGRADENDTDTDTDTTGNDQSSGQSFIGVSGSVTGVAEESNEGSEGIDPTELVADTDNSSVYKSEYADNNGESESDMDFSGSGSEEHRTGTDNSEQELTDSGWVYYGECRITFYDDCEECCGVAGNTTASGVYPASNHTVATGEDLPFGTELLIDGQVYVVEDRGVDPYCVDVFVDEHETAVALGMYYTDVYMRFAE